MITGLIKYNNKEIIEKRQFNQLILSIVLYFKVSIFSFSIIYHYYIIYYIFIISFTTLFSDAPVLTHVTLYIIDTGDNLSIKYKNYCYDKKKSHIIEWHVKKMLKGSISERMKLQYFSAIVLCRKNNGKPVDDPESWKVTIDYRKLNKQSTIHSYPMPRRENVLHGVKIHEIMSTF